MQPLLIQILILLLALGLAVQACIGLWFLLSCIWEKEPRATVFAWLQFLGMLGLLIFFLFLSRIGFFDTGAGFASLVGVTLLAVLCAFLGLVKMGKNPKALLGTQGLMVGPVKRFDERDQVFARNRALRPKSEQYKAYYREHPEWRPWMRIEGSGADP